MRADQLDLFGAVPEQAGGGRSLYPESVGALAAALPQHVHLGTSSWTFPGWQGLVYLRSYASQRSFIRDSLREYAQYPLFKTVGVDRAHYAPLNADEWRAYAAQLPSGFPCVIKLWDELSLISFPDHERYGARRGTRNASFLDPVLLRDAVAAPLREGFRDHIAALVLELAPQRNPPPARQFEDRLAKFLDRAPHDLPLAIELRNRELLTPRYLSILKHFGASHVLNFWTGMPTLREQLTLPGILSGPRAVARLSLPPFTTYAQRKRELEPFDRVQDPQPALHEDVAELAYRAGELGQALFITVGNKVEGCAPSTVASLASRITGVR
ncbi:MAG TPA: DUF72 domain-containing protein [Polyangiales bacterium]